MRCCGLCVVGVLVVAGAACRPQVDSERAQSEELATRAPAQYSVADFYTNVSYAGASWSRDKQRLLVSSNQSGIWNAYELPAEGGELKPLTQSTGDSIFAISYFPSDDRMLYSSDRGGNELNHLHVRNPDGSVRDLTPGDKLKASFLGWAADDQSFFVATNGRDERYFDLYEMSVDGYRSTLLYRNTTGFELGPISRDKRYIALSKPRTTNDADIFLHDRQTGETKNITAHTGSVNNFPTDFSPDGSKLLYASDRDREFIALLSYTSRQAPSPRSMRNRGTSPAQATRGEASTWWCMSTRIHATPGACWTL